MFSRTMKWGGLYAQMTMKRANIVTLARPLKGGTWLFTHTPSQLVGENITHTSYRAMYVPVRAASCLKPRRSLIISGQTGCSISAIYSHHIFAVRREPLSVPSRGPETPGSDAGQDRRRRRRHQTRLTWKISANQKGKIWSRWN